MLNKATSLLILRPVSSAVPFCILPAAQPSPNACLVRDPSGLQLATRLYILSHLPHTVHHDDLCHMGNPLGPVKHERLRFHRGKPARSSRHFDAAARAKSVGYSTFFNSACPARIMSSFTPSKHPRKLFALSTTSSNLCRASLRNSDDPVLLSLDC